jgi:L-fuculose-phosphate aldolase
MMADRGVPATENAARRALVDACLQMNALGINQGKAGNASLRWDRGGAPGLLITPSALAYDAMGSDDIVWLSMATAPGADGEPAPRHADGARPPSSEWRMHRDVYAARAEVAAVVHSHATFASTLACTERVQRDGIPAFHYMIALFGGTDVRCARYATFGTQALSDHALHALQARLACLLANHGLLAVGDSLERALALALELETLSRMYWQALQLGEPVVLDAQEMQRVIARFADYG